jgi:sec-independent protein translocase protein TatA
MFGKTEDLVIVLLIVLLLFGAKKLPDLARSLGESVKEVRKGFNDEPASEKTTSSKSSSAKKA